VQSVQTFGRKVSPFHADCSQCLVCPSYSHVKINRTTCLQKNAVAVAYAKQGKGVMRLNGVLLAPSAMGAMNVIARCRSSQSCTGSAIEVLCNIALVS
jgi:hypothetical protein